MKFCPQCGAELNPESKFCMSCGASVAPSDTDPQHVPSSSPGQSGYKFKEPDFKQASEDFTAALTGKTNLIDRVKNILMKPKLEWPVIYSEQSNPMKILFGYVIILALIPTIAAIIGYGLVGHTVLGFNYRSWSTAFETGIIQFLSAIIGVFLTAWIVDLLAPSFESEKNFGRSFQLVAYSYTPGWIAGIILLVPSLSLIMTIAMVYSIYLLATGLPVLKHTPKDKVVGYVVITIICIIVISIAIATILATILGIFFVSRSGLGFGY